MSELSGCVCGHHSSRMGVRVTIKSIILVFTMLAAEGGGGGGGVVGVGTIDNWLTADAILCTTLM